YDGRSADSVGFSDARPGPPRARSVAPRARPAHTPRADHPIHRTRFRACRSLVSLARSSLESLTAAPAPAPADPRPPRTRCTRMPGTRLSSTLGGGAAALGAVLVVALPAVSWANSV